MNESITNFLSSDPIFKNLSAEELTTIAEQMGTVNASQGDVIFQEGDKGDHMCFVMDGTLEVHKQAMSGQDASIATLGKGACLGEMSIIDQLPRSATVKAQTSAQLIVLTREAFDTLTENHPQIAIKVLKGIARKLSLNLRRGSAVIADTKK